MNKSLKLLQFGLIAAFLLVWLKLPEPAAKPVSAMVVAAFFLSVFVESVINKEGYLRLSVVKKSENKGKYYLVLVIHLAFAAALLTYAAIQMVGR